MASQLVQFPERPMPGDVGYETDAMNPSRGMVNAVPLAILLWAGILWLIFHLVL